MKHKIIINVTDPNGRKANVLRGADMKLPARLVRFLFGDFQQVYLCNLDQKVLAWSYKRVNEIFDRKPVDIKF